MRMKKNMMNLFRRFLVKYKQRSKKYNVVINNIIQTQGMQGVTFSQNAEDFLMISLVGDKVGTYVDVGAHHPVRFSNTYQLYLRGWNGINIDPLPKSKHLFDTYRPDDINLEVGISSEVKETDYYCFDEPAFNTISSKVAEERARNKEALLSKKIKIEMRRLDEVFSEHLMGRSIELLNIDVESKELDVLMSNDWDKYRPQYILIESLGLKNSDVFDLKKDPAVMFLIDNGYIVIAKMFREVLLLDCRGHCDK